MVEGEGEGGEGGRCVCRFDNPIPFGAIEFLWKPHKFRGIFNSKEKKSENPFCRLPTNLAKCQRGWGNLLHLANSWNVTLESFKVRPLPLLLLPPNPGLVNGFSCCSFFLLLHSFASFALIMPPHICMYVCMDVCVCLRLSYPSPPIRVSNRMACAMNRIKY